MRSAACPSTPAATEPVAICIGISNRIRVSIISTSCSINCPRAAASSVAISTAPPLADVIAPSCIIIVSTMSLNVCETENA